MKILHLIDEAAAAVSSGEWMLLEDNAHNQLGQICRFCVCLTCSPFYQSSASSLGR